MEWTEKDNALHKTYAFKSFGDAISFMQKAVPKIDTLNHHPEWSNIYNRVSCKLCTHDAGNIITSKDHELSALLDETYMEIVRP
jgi:4a-hydroxytetrahydrobiopterin dehydratase